VVSTVTWDPNQYYYSLVDLPCEMCWPFSDFTYVYFYKNYETSTTNPVRERCGYLKATLDFFTWSYRADTALAVATKQNFVRPPAAITEAVIDAMRGITCDSQLLYVGSQVGRWRAQQPSSPNQLEFVLTCTDKANVPWGIIAGIASLGVVIIVGLVRLATVHHCCSRKSLSFAMFSASDESRPLIPRGPHK
jgi:hypothetical protein